MEDGASDPPTLEGKYEEIGMAQEGGESGGESGEGSGEEEYDPVDLARWQLETLYAEVNPDNVAKIDGFLEKYKGREDRLVEKAYKKYDRPVPMPDSDDSGSASGSAESGSAPASPTPGGGAGDLHTLHEADIVLTGPSRCSKTPLSMYLAQRGYRTGNVPLVAGMEAPRALLEADPRKVFGLIIDVTTLLGVRQARVRELHSSPYSWSV